MHEFLTKKLAEMVEAHAHAKRHADEMGAKAEEARRAAVIPNQVESHLADVIAKIRNALEWVKNQNSTDAIPF